MTINSCSETQILIFLFKNRRRTLLMRSENGVKVNNFQLWFRRSENFDRCECHSRVVTDDFGYLGLHHFL